MDHLSQRLLLRLHRPNLLDQAQDHLSHDRGVIDQISALTDPPVRVVMDLPVVKSAHREEDQLQALDHHMGHMVRIAIMMMAYLDIRIIQLRHRNAQKTLT